MNICQVISTPLPPREGIGFYAWSLARHLQEQGCQVQLITRRSRGEPVFQVLEGIPIWRPFFLPLYPFHVHLHGLFAQQVVRQLEGWADMFHCHTPLVPAPHMNKPILVTVHTPM